MKRYISLSLALTALDQAIKLLIRRLPRGSILFKIPHVLCITHRANTGAAFSLFAGRTAFVTLMSAALLVGVVWLFFRVMRPSRAAKLALAVLIGGGLGNMIDRVLLGSVTDYIRVLFINFPVFNFADICITMSIGVLLFLLLTGRLEERG